MGTRIRGAQLVPALSVDSTLRVGPVGTGSLAPVEFVSASDAGIALTSTSAVAVELYWAGFMKDSGGTLQKVGAAAFQWTDNNTTNGYASWNIHSSWMNAGVQTDDVWLCGWGNRGAAFFPPSLAAASAPGAGVLKINGNLVVTADVTAGAGIFALSSNVLVNFLSMRNASAGNAAVSRFRIGTNVSPNAFTIDLFGSGHATLPNVANFINQVNGVLNMGGFGVTAVTMGAGGAVQLPAYTAATFVAGDKYLVVDAAGNVHRSAVGPAS